MVVENAVGNPKLHIAQPKADSVATFVPARLPELETAHATKIEAVILAILKPNETNTGQAYQAYSQIAEAVYSDKLVNLSPSEKTKTLYGLTHRVARIRIDFIKHINNPITDKLSQTMHARALSILGKARLRFPFYETFTDEQLIDMISNKMIFSGVERKMERKDIAIGKKKTELALSLCKRNPDGTFVFTHSGDHQLILAHYNEGLAECTPSKQEAKISQRARRAGFSMRQLAIRLRNMDAGIKDSPARELLEKMRESDPLNKDLNVQDAIDLVLRRKIQEYSRLRKYRNVPIEHQIARRGSDIPVFVRGRPGKEVLLTLYDYTMPARRNKERSEEQKEGIPLPELPTDIWALSRQELLVYSLMLISDSRDAYCYPEVESAVPDLYRDVLNKVPVERRQPALESLTSDAEQSVSNFVEQLERYKEFDEDNYTIPDASQSVINFVEWVRDQEVYDSYTLEAIMDILLRKTKPTEVFMTYEEFLNIHEEAIRATKKARKLHALNARMLLGQEAKEEEEDLSA
jgi:hypothetical protein